MKPGMWWSYSRNMRLRPAIWAFKSLKLRNKGEPLWYSAAFCFCFIFCRQCWRVYFIVPRRAKNVVLLLFSLFFYAWGEPVYIFLMLFSICMDYLLGLWMERAKQAPGRVKVLALAVVLNVALSWLF